MGMISFDEEEIRPMIPKLENLTQHFDPIIPSTETIAFSELGVEKCVGIVDIVNSTKISASISGPKMGKYYGIFINTMSTIVQKYGGRVVKNIGDSILFYFPQSSPSTFDLERSIECGLAMVFAHDTINKLLSQEGLPALDYRISLDYGSIMLARSATSSCEDIFGPPVNMCAKINHNAKPNTVVIGGDLHQMIKGLDYKFEEAKPYAVGFKFKYPIYTISYNEGTNVHLITSTIEKTLMEMGDAPLEKIVSILFNDYRCFLPDCYKHPEYLKRILQDLYGSSHMAIIQSITERLEEYSFRRPVNDFVARLNG
jgi:class 3 adenylate cyclase